MYCLDTNIIVEILRGDLTLKSKIEENKEQIFITPITICELYRGTFGHVHKDKKVSDVENVIQYFEILDLDLASCKEFGRNYKKLSDSGNMITEFDLIIASIVKTNNLIFVTRDKKHFEGLGIKVEEW